MKKELIVEMEEECISCPKLDLETVTKKEGWVTVVDHKCKHLEFCKEVRHHWEIVKKVKEDRGWAKLAGLKQ